jgi:hypothetical protein
MVRQKNSFIVYKFDLYFLLNFNEFFSSLPDPENVSVKFADHNQHQPHTGSTIGGLYFSLQPNPRPSIGGSFLSHQPNPRMIKKLGKVSFKFNVFKA